MQSSHNIHVKRIVLFLVIVAVAGYAAKRIFTPASFGVYGHYRAAAIEEEANRELRHWTNASCLSCHPYVRELHLGGLHKTISCEFCHGTYADHIKDGKKVGTLPVKKGEQITTLCLRCHNRAIKARPHEVIKTIVMPKHLEDKHVRITHTCNQCHNVHAPLYYIKKAREIMGIKEAD